MLLLEGKSVIVTGASRGIGRAIAIGCAQHGADVAINYASASGPAQEVVDEIRALGRRALACKGDVANAGICDFHAFLDMPPELLRRTVGVNFEGTYFVAQAAARRMKEQGRGGSIVAISSISKLVGGEFQSHYTPTKAAQHALMQSAAIALGRFGIRCNSVLPGTIVTDINRDDLTPEKTAYFNQRIPLGRLGQPDDIAGSVVFLASDLARYVTGAEILVDGGMFVNLQ
jgi:L-rhamnose 1-dehydrogenase